MNNDKNGFKSYINDLYKSFRESVLPVKKTDSTIKKYSKNIGASALLVLTLVILSIVVLSISFVL